MSNSSLVTKGFHQAHSGNYTANRAANGGSQKKITLHHFAGNLSLEWLAQLWQTVGREGSSHYGVKDRDIIQCVNESDIAWTDGDWESNKNSITIEVSNSGGVPDWPVSAESLETAAQLCADIAKRNGLGKLVKGQNLTWHQMYASTACPGPHMLASIDAIANRANEINAQGASTPPTSTPAPSGTAKYKVQIGAFGNKANAESLAAKAKAKGFETYIAQEGGMYKVQLGAFNDEANAKALGDKAKAAGFEVYIAGLSTSAAAAPVAAPAPSIGVGSTVRINQGATDYNGTSMMPFVYGRDNIVSELNGDRAVVTVGGVVVGAFRLSDLTLV